MTYECGNDVQFGDTIACIDDKGQVPIGATVHEGEHYTVEELNRGTHVSLYEITGAMWTPDRFRLVSRSSLVEIEATVIGIERQGMAGMPWSPNVGLQVRGNLAGVKPVVVSEWD